jgi:hypothetical protein
MSPNPNFNTILSTTLDNYRKSLTDNVFNSRPLLWYLTEKKRRRMLNGGVKIVEPLIHAEGQSDTYGEWEQLSIVPQQGISAAEFPWKAVFASIAISGLEEAQNNGKEAIVNLLEAKIMQAEETLKSKLSTMAYGDGTGNSGKDWLGLDVLIDDAAPVGGIDPGDPGSEFWASYVEDFTGTASPAEWFEKELRTAVNSTGDTGKDRVDGIFTGQDVYELYESLLTPNVRYSDAKSANLGFQNLMFKQIPLYFDYDCPAGHVFGVNSKYVGVVGHSDRWFKQSKFTDGLSGNTSSAHASNGNASTVDARYALITTYGNMTIRNRRRCFKLTGVGLPGGG